jgi:phosphoserine phosphatase
VTHRFLFDFDGTVTRAELLPRLGRELGRESELAELTRRTIRGEIPFEVSFRYRVELPRDIPVSRVAQIVAEIELDPRIEAFIRANRERCVIVTGNLDAWVGARCRELCGTVFCSTARVEGDRIAEITHVLDKAEAAAAEPGAFAAIGDGHGDIPMVERAAFGIAYGGVHPPAPGLLEVASHACFDGETLCRLLSQL